MIFFYLLFLGFAVSIDGFVAGISYGLKDISIPTTSLIIIFITTIIFTAVAMSTACILGTFINSQFAILLGALLLMIIGLFSLFQEYLTKGAHDDMIAGETNIPKVTFSIGRLVINIMADPEKADMDHSRGINSLEALLISLALGLDNSIATFAAALMESLPFYTPLIMGCIQIVVLIAGIYTSKYFISDTVKKRFSYMPGILLILLGLLRLM